jgi:hypothetical protein
VEYERLLEDQKKLLDKVTAAEAALNSVATMEDPVAYAKAREKANKARADLEATKARADQIKNNAPEGRIRSTGEIQKELDQVKPQAQAAEDQTAKDAEALNAKLKAEQLAREYREKEYRRALDKIARDQNGGVNDQGNLNTPPPGLPGPPVPLPPPAAPGSTLPAPPPGFGPGELNPPRVPTNAPAPTYGPQPNVPAQPPAPFGEDVAELDRKRQEAEAAGLKAEAEKHRKAAEQLLQEKLDAANHKTVTAMDGGDEAGTQRGLDESAKYRAERDRRQSQRDNASAPAPVAAPQAAAAPQGVQGTDKVVTSNEQVNQAILKMADAVVKANADLIKRLVDLEQKFRNQGVRA